MAIKLLLHVYKKFKGKFSNNSDNKLKNNKKDSKNKEEER